MRVSFFENIRDKNPAHLELTWEEFVEASAEHEYVDAGPSNESRKAAKESCPLMCPAEFVAGGKRCTADAVRVWLAVIDLDGTDVDPSNPKKKIPGIRLEQLAQVLELCAPYEYLRYTSFSHAFCKDGRSKLRIVLPLSRPVLRSEWDRFWPRMIAHLSAGMGDPQCCNVDRFYIEPYAPIGTEAQNYVHYNPGKVLDVVEVMSLPGPVPLSDVAEAKGEEALTPEHMTALRGALRRRGTPHALIVRKALLAIAEGKTYAGEGEREKTLFKVIGEIVRAFPLCETESVVAIFSASHARMALDAPDPPTAELVRYKLSKAKEGIVAEAEQKAQILESDLKIRIREAFHGARDYAYTTDEAEKIRENAGLSEEEMHSHWIYQKAQSYYFRVLDKIRGPKVAAEMAKTATILLAPAATCGVDPYTITPAGAVLPKSPAQLVEDYGTPVDQVQASLIAQETHYDRSTGTLVEAVCPRRILTPQEDGEVGEWLQLFAGDKYEKVLDWLALITDLSQPLPALYFDGPKGTGKSLFAESIARLWTTTQATPLDTLSRSFNSQITECPVVFADEIVPPEFRGDKGTGRLRALIAERSRSLTRKFLPDTTLIGSIRLIIAGNNDTLISAEENLTENDIAAIVDRILYLEVTQDAADYLQSLPDLGESFRMADRVARHVLWLEENRTVIKRTRFGVPGEAGKLHQTLTVSAGSRSPVLNWLAGALLNWDAVVSRPKVGAGLRVVEGEIWVNASAIVEGWDLVKTNARAPSTQRIGKAIATFSKPNRKEYAGVKYQVIKTENLLAWATQTGYMSSEQLRACINHAEQRTHKRAN